MKLHINRHSLARPNCRRISYNGVSNVRLVHIGLATGKRLDIAGCRLRLEILAGSRSGGLAVVVVYVSIVVLFRVVVSHRYRGRRPGQGVFLEMAHTQRRWTDASFARSDLREGQRPSGRQRGWYAGRSVAPQSTPSRRERPDVIGASWPWEDMNMLGGREVDSAATRGRRGGTTSYVTVAFVRGSVVG